jgi:hypothetical protein
MKYSVVTTFNASGYKQYGSRMIDTFLKNWPATVQLKVYAENCNVVQTAPNLQVVDLETASPGLVSFKQQWKNVPKATGWCNDSTQKFADKTQKVGFKWDAVRFAHKVYAIFDCAKTTDADILIWLDADNVCHSPISLDSVAKFCPADIDLGFLGREGKYTECGLYSMNLRSAAVQAFLQEFQRMYDDAESGIFTLDEWHDSFVFDAVREKFKGQLKELNWSAGVVRGEGHPLINSAWGAYLDHLKGDRKDLGRSKSKDLKITRQEAYWQ